MQTASVFGQVPEVAINYEEHAGQAEVSDSLALNFSSPAPASIIEIIAGRGWGKTLYLVCSILAPFLDQTPSAKVMWVAPNYQTAMTPIDDVFKGSDETTGDRYVPEFDRAGNRVWEFVTTKSGPTLTWWNGASVVFRSADAPDSIVSKGFNLVIIDEAALVPELVFNLQILGTARKAGIKIFLITTPRGKKHWTYKFFLKGQDTQDSEYISFQQPFTKNPFHSKVQARLMMDLPDWLRKQEYEAEFVDDGDSVIKGLEGVIFGDSIDFPSSQQEWATELEAVEITPAFGEHEAVTRTPGERTFVVAMDLAKQKDFTVIVVMDMETGALVYYKRMNKEDYRVVLDTVSSVCRRFNNADLIFDSTGVGAGLADIIAEYDMVAHPFTFTNDSKVEIINKLILAVEYGEIRLPNITTMKAELSAYTYTLTRTGKISYNAPAGLHDDIVVSIALANWYRKENAGSTEVNVIDEVIDFNRGRRIAVPGEKDLGRPARSIEEMFGDMGD